jgi:hypothetical protein
MRYPARVLGAAALAAAAFGTAAPANAACAGTANTVTTCVTVNLHGAPSVNLNGDSYDDCVYVASSQCTPVSVPIPTVEEGSGSLVTFTCANQVGRKYLQCEILSFTTT